MSLYVSEFMLCVRKDVIFSPPVVGSIFDEDEQKSDGRRQQIRDWFDDGSRAGTDDSILVNFCRWTDSGEFVNDLWVIVHRELWDRERVDLYAPSNFYLLEVSRARLDFVFVAHHE